MKRFDCRFLLFLLILGGCAGTNGPQYTQAPKTYNAQRTTNVQAGETVYDVAKRLNVSVRDLIDANNLQAPYTVKTGQSLAFPVPQSYTVAKGDTLYAITHRFGVDQTAVAQMNHLSAPYKLTTGQTLQLPSPHKDTQVASNAPPTASSSYSTGPLKPSSSAVEAVPLGPQTATPSKTNLSSPTALAPIASTAPAPPITLAPVAPPTGFVGIAQRILVAGSGRDRFGVRAEAWRPA